MLPLVTAAVALRAWVLCLLLAACGGISLASDARVNADADIESQAVDLYRCRFEEDNDANFDAWPDGWTRRRGPGYPQYIGARIRPRPGGKGNCLQIDMDGGAVRLTTPPMPVSAPFSYAVDVAIKVERLKRDLVTLTIEYLNENHEVLQSLESDSVAAGEWQQLRLGPFAPRSKKCRWAVISLHIRPGEREDLSGTVLVDDLLFRRLPQMSLVAEEQTPVYLLGEHVTVRAEITGIMVTDSVLTFRLVNMQGKQLAEHRQPLGGDRLARETEEGLGSREAWATETWRPPIREAGFYYVVANLAGRDGSQLERFVRVAVVEPAPLPSLGEFGWSLPDADQPLGPKRMLHLLRHAGVNWVKYPAWHGERDTEHMEAIAGFADQLDLHGVQMVGLLDRPPPEISRQFDSQTTPPVAIVIADPQSIKVSLDAVFTNLSLKVRWWQLGSDDDTSFVGDPELPAKMTRIREQLNRYGESMQLGFAWKSVFHPPVLPDKPHNFMVLTDHPGYTAGELMQLPRFNHWSGDAVPWITLEPLADGEYDDRVRVRDLVQRMVTARIAGAGMVCVPKPFDDEHGLFYRDGTPGELFLPWRTTAYALAGREYIGSVQLRQGSENHLFALGDEAVMVLWNDRECDEEIYLGEDLQVMNLWGGREKVTEVNDDGRVLRTVKAGPDPVFIFGIHSRLAQFCSSFQFENMQLQSLLGRSQSVRYRYTNTFGKNLTGKVMLHAPALLESPSPVFLRASPLETRRDSFPLLLRPDAGSGVRTVRIDFELAGERAHRFSIHRQINIGLTGIEIDVETRLNKEGLLEVRLQMSNQTERKVAFQCSLFAPGRRREKMQILAPPDERGSASVFLPDGKELIGQDLLIRFEELGGQRIMNQSVTARE